MTLEEVIRRTDAGCNYVVRHFGEDCPLFVYNANNATDEEIEKIISVLGDLEVSRIKAEIDFDHKIYLCYTIDITSAEYEDMMRGEKEWRRY